MGNKEAQKEETVIKNLPGLVRYVAIIRRQNESPSEYPISLLCGRDPKEWSVEYPDYPSEGTILSIRSLPNWEEPKLFITRNDGMNIENCGISQLDQNQLDLVTQVFDALSAEVLI